MNAFDMRLMSFLISSSDSLGFTATGLFALPAMAAADLVVVVCGGQGLSRFLVGDPSAPCVSRARRRFRLISSMSFVLSARTSSCDKQ